MAGWSLCASSSPKPTGQERDLRGGDCPPGDPAGTVRWDQASITGEELPPYKIPLLGRLYGDTSGQHAQVNRFYDAIERINGHENQITGLRESGRSKEALEYIQNNPETRLVAMAIAVEREMDSLRKLKRKVLDAGDKERVKLLDERINTRMADFNQRVARIEELGKNLKSSVEENGSIKGRYDDGLGR